MRMLAALRPFRCTTRRILDKVVYGHESDQPLPEDAVREARGREIGQMADVVGSDARGKLVRAK